MNHKFCFIACVNNEKYWNECLYYINKLEIPPECEVEIMAIRNAESMASAYHYAMHHTDAKYKIYLHQDTFIINHLFLYALLEYFQKNDNLGLIGIIGAKRLPNSFIWWETKEPAGKVLESCTVKTRFINCDKEIYYLTEVEAVDGLLMATQYDCPWRMDVFDGWHFYDISQCMEFKKNGYLVAVPYQSSPWVLHDCGISTINVYYKYRDLFENEYKSFINRLRN